MKHEAHLFHLLQQCAKRGVAPRLDKLNRVQNNVFPPLKPASKRTVSLKWETALRALCLVNFGCSDEGNYAEKIFIRHILENCMFPSSCWKFYLESLGKWIQLESAPSLPHFSVCQNLSFNALSQALFHLSVQKNSSTSCGESLMLYKFISQKYSWAKNINLVSIRHYVFVTLLKNRKWDRALRFFFETLNHKEFPSPSATGFLITSLGENMKWEEILSIYDISMKYCSRKLSRSPLQDVAVLQKAWGTVFSMAMNNVTMHHPNLLFSMMEKLVLLNEKSSIQPVGRLDGNFLQSVERLSKDQRLKLVSVAKNHDLLDYYKIVRGLVSQKRWIDALDTFCNAMKSHGSVRSSFFSRSDIGRSRLALLHSSGSWNAHLIVEGINRFRKRRDLLLLNDAELECVFSKSLESDNSIFWLYCLRLLHANFSFDRLDNKKRFLPSHAMLSLLFRNKKLPWTEGLRIFYSYLSNYSDSVTHKGSENNVFSFSVVLDSLLRLMYSNNAQKEADELVVRVCRHYKCALPGVFLQKSERKVLEAVIKTNKKIASSTLYYILGYDGENIEGISRSLLCLHLYMKAEVGRGFLEGKCLSESDFPWADRVPASVHIQALRRIGKCKLPEPSKYTLTKDYLSYLISQNAPKYRLKSSNESLYCIVYESFIIFLEDYNIVKTNEENNNSAYFYFEDMLELAVRTYGSFPPFYMFLPNQLDRLLPRISQVNLNPLTIAFRCKFAKKIVNLIISFFQEKRHLPQSQLVILNGLLKLCCRIVEHERLIVDKKILVTEPSGGFVDRSIQVADYALRLVKWEIELSNSAAISTHLLLLYKTISLSCCKNEYWEKALGLTSLVVLRLKKSSSSSGFPENNKNASFSVVNEIHYKEFSRSFGWEVGLNFWYRYFPCEVLRNISGSSAAVDYCLSLSI